MLKASDMPMHDLLALVWLGGNIISIILRRQRCYIPNPYYVPTLLIWPYPIILTRVVRKLKKFSSSLIGSSLQDQTYSLKKSISRNPFNSIQPPFIWARVISTLNYVISTYT